MSSRGCIARAHTHLAHMLCTHPTKCVHTPRLELLSRGLSTTDVCGSRLSRGAALGIVGCPASLSPRASSRWHHPPQVTTKHVSDAAACPPVRPKSALAEHL